MSEAGTVAEGIEQLSHHPQWVLLDLMLPDGSGISVLAHIKAQRMASRICVITGCDSAMLHEARRAGAEHIFIKPLDLERLMAVLKS